MEDKSLNNYTTTVMAARAAAVAAAQSVNQQIMKQINLTTVDTSISSPPSQPSPPFARIKDEAQLTAEKEAEQKRLEEEMRKRRERIEKWRHEKKNKEPKDHSQTAQPAHDASKQNGNNKGWNLEDDDDDEEASHANGRAKPVDDKQNYMDLKQSIEEQPAPVKKEAKKEEDDEDPLEAYMKEINKKAPKVMVEAKKKVESVLAVKSEKSIPKLAEQKNDDESLKSKKVTIMMGVAKAANTETREKGQIMEQDIDGLEYDSDEEPSGAFSDDILLDGAPKLKTKSEMVFTDHSKVYYRPFTKNFYVEVPEISKMTNEEVELYREELEGVKINGKNCPKPIKTWAQCGVTLKVMECLRKNVFEKPTPIQAQSLPIIMSGRDLIAIAKTGSGKTLAFLLPMFRHILDQPPLEIDDGPIAIIMTPTRELAMQIAKECKKFTKSLNISVVAVYGGTNISEQIAELKRGAEIIVCTPGRMIDMLAANNGRVTNLRRVTYVVLDEADRMFDLVIFFFKT
jgi:ATP-dependent RNA helicase DDX46/PRP5